MSPKTGGVWLGDAKQEETTIVAHSMRTSLVSPASHKGLRCGPAQLQGWLRHMKIGVRSLGVCMCFRGFCRGGDCVATESQSICEVLYLLLHTFKKRVVNHKQNITKKLKISSPLSLKIPTYLSPFLKVQLVPVPVGFCFVCFFISTTFLFWDNFD